MTTPSETSEHNVKSRRPAESAFKQQRLPAWQPILTAGTVLPTFIILGIAFIPVGIGLLYFSEEVKEYVHDYTHCLANDANLDLNITCAEMIKQQPKAECVCRETLNLTEDFKGSVYFYYGLTNYYQNHRRYVKSRDDNQLLGRLSLTPSSDCEPFAYNNGVPIAPCGAIANSLFNDTLTLYSLAMAADVPTNKTNIAWGSDRNIKFRNPPGVLKEVFANYSKPVNWEKNIWELDLENPDNNGFQNEDLIVWMRTAALPTFRKLYRRVEHSYQGYTDGLPKGLYNLKIDYKYPVTDFHGTKTFIISTTSLLGGKNPFLGVAYVVVGTLCLVLGLVLLIVHVKCSKRMDISDYINEKLRGGQPSASRQYLDVTDSNGVTNTTIHEESGNTNRFVPSWRHLREISRNTAARLRALVNRNNEPNGTSEGPASFLAIRQEPYISGPQLWLSRRSWRTDHPASSRETVL